MESQTHNSTTEDPENGSRSPTQCLKARWSSASDDSAATVHVGDSTRCKTEMQESGGDYLSRLCVQIEEASDSEFDGEIDIDEEEVEKLGDGIWVHQAFLAYLVDPKDMDIICFRYVDPDEWMAVAPEWQCALGFGSSIEEASADLQSKLVATKLTFIEERKIEDIRRIPHDPRPERAREIREGWRDGDYDDFRKAYFDDLQNDPSCREVKWSTIQV